MCLYWELTLPLETHYFQTHLCSVETSRVCGVHGCRCSTVGDSQLTAAPTEIPKAIRVRSDWRPSAMPTATKDTIRNIEITLFS